MSTSELLISRCYWDTRQQAAHIPTWTGDERAPLILTEEDEGLPFLITEGEEESPLLLKREDEGSPLLRRGRNRNRDRGQGSEGDIMILGDKLHVVTVITAIYVPVSFLITYAIAVSNGHVEAGFPYISDTGTLPPESCIFGQLLNFGALLAAWVVYIRYKQVQATYLPVNRQGILRANTVAFILGLLTATGVSIVGNFQETNVIVVHIIGAFMAFGIGGLYCFVQTGMSFKMTELPGATPFINKLRVFLCVADTIFFILTVLIATYLASLQQDHSLKWQPHNPGYAEHLVATISEWLIAIFIVMYFLTFYKEFHRFRFTSPQVVFDIKPDMGNNQPNRHNCTERTTGTEFANNLHTSATGEGSLP